MSVVDEQGAVRQYAVDIKVRFVFRASAFTFLDVLRWI
jgi:hypothetical protein